MITSQSIWSHTDVNDEQATADSNHMHNKMFSIHDSNDVKNEKLN